MSRLPPGPVMMGLESETLSPLEKELIQHPTIGGVIFFSRNYESPEQLKALIDLIHSLRPTGLITAVDQEGGRVQRFKKGFTLLPPLRRFGELYDQAQEQAKELAEAGGWLMAAEVLSVGVDISFAPVLDIDRGISEVIGDRAIHQDPEVIAEIATAYIRGMKQAGMAASGKHFPGHGGVEVDTHLGIARDNRDSDILEKEDMLPFKRLIEVGLPAIMMAHVIYPDVDDLPAGFSKIWVRDILRKQMGFNGVVFSDDLLMEGARVIGDVPETAEYALQAGCDMVLICRGEELIGRAIDRINSMADAESQRRIEQLRGKGSLNYRQLAGQRAWQQAVQKVTENC